MQEKSLILFKPNDFDIPSMYDYVNDKLEKNNLSIENESLQCLSMSQVCNLWSVISDDKLLYYIHAELYESVPIKILEVNGEGAINKVLKIKERVRSIYAKGIFRNCMHSPINIKEYNDHIETIQNKNNAQDFRFKELPYDTFKKLDGELCKKLARFIVNINLYTMIPYVTPYYVSPNRYRCYMIEDEVNAFTDYVCFICDCFEQYDIYDSAILATILLTNGEVCLIDGNDEKAVREILEKGRKYNLTMKLHCIE